MSEPAQFKPIPYCFTLVDMDNKPIVMTERIRAICPPFYVLLDHAIAVIWLLFSQESEEVDLGSAQITWALRFLEGMAIDCECCSVDVKLAIKCLRRAFVNCVSQNLPVKDLNEEEKVETTEESEENENTEFTKMINTSVLLKDMLT